MEFTRLIASISENGGLYGVSVTDDWLQGRTAYGGLAAAICLESARRAIPDLPPLRSAQFSFVGPASGPLVIRSDLLRRGKSTAFVGTDLSGDAGLATRATFCFGSARPSALDYEECPAPEVAPPDECPGFFRHVAGLNFTQHFDGKLAAGHPPISQAGAPTMTLWLKHRDPDLQPSIVSLLALADAPPPAAAVLFSKFAPISTMTWAVDLFTDELETENGWWLVRTAAENATAGYSNQAMMIWNAAGKPVLAARQSIAVFQ